LELSYDPNLGIPSESLPMLEDRESLSSELDELKPIVDDSPYEEVRAAVSNTDDPSLPCVPSWSIGLMIGNNSSVGDWESLHNPRFRTEYAVFDA